MSGTIVVLFKGLCVLSALRRVVPSAEGRTIYYWNPNDVKLPSAYLTAAAVDPADREEPAAAAAQDDRQELAIENRCRWKSSATTRTIDPKSSGTKNRWAVTGAAYGGEPKSRTKRGGWGRLFGRTASTNKAATATPNSTAADGHVSTATKSTSSGSTATEQNSPRSADDGDAIVRKMFSALLNYAATASQPRPSTVAATTRAAAGRESQPRRRLPQRKKFMTTAAAVSEDTADWIGPVALPAMRYQDPILAQESVSVDYPNGYSLMDKGAVDDAMVAAAEDKFYDEDATERPMDLVWKTNVVGEHAAAAKSAASVGAAAGDDDDDD